MVWLTWALSMAQVSRDHEQPARLLGQCGRCISTAGKATQAFPGSRAGMILLRAESSWKSWKQIHALAYERLFGP